MLMLDQIAQMAQEVGWQLPNEILPGPVCYQSYGEEENKLDAAFVAYLACSQFLVSRYIECIRCLKQHIYHCQITLAIVLNIISINRRGGGGSLQELIETGWYDLSPSSPNDGNSIFRQALYN